MLPTNQRHAGDDYMTWTLPADRETDDMPHEDVNALTALWMRIDETLEALKAEPISNYFTPDDRLVLTNELTRKRAAIDELLKDY